MTRYGTNIYNAFTYGNPAGYNNADISPFVASAVDYGKVHLTYTNPVGIEGNDFAYKEFRIVRNQDGIPDTPEDGVIIYASTTPSTEREPVLIEDYSPIIKRNSVVVSTTTPEIVTGKYVYYGAWLFINTAWVCIGVAETLVAGEHSTPIGVVDGVNSKAFTRTTHEKLMDLLPRVYTSSSANGVDVVDYSGTLSQFLAGFSYTIDELLTFTDLLAPQHSLTNVPKPFLDVRSVEVNVPLENRISTKFQRQLLREINWIYSRKGTSSALVDAIESMTGFSTTISDSPNLMLSVQDSTFIDWLSYSEWKLKNQVVITDAVGDGSRVTYTSDNLFKLGQKVTVTGVTPTDFNVSEAVIVAVSETEFTVELAVEGSVSYVSGGIATLDANVPYTLWRTIGACTLEADLTTLSSDVPPETYALDKQACGLVDASVANTSIAYGKTDTITRGIPVAENKSYSLSFYVKSLVTAGVEFEITWYGYDGSKLYSDAPISEAVNTTWNRKVLTAVSPTSVSSLVSEIEISSNVVTLTVTDAKFYTVGQPVTVQFAESTTYDDINGTYPITATTDSTISFDFTRTDLSTTTTSGQAGAKGAAFAGFSLTFLDAGQYYVDMFQFAEDDTSELEYYEPRGAIVDIAPNKVNFIREPSFETGSVYTWNLDGGTATGTTVLSPPPIPTSNGIEIYQITNTGGSVSFSTGIPVDGLTDGAWYTFSIYAKSDVETSVDLYSIVTSDDGSGGFINTEDTVTRTVGTSWTRIEHSFWVTKGAALIPVPIGLSINFSDAVVLSLDCAQLEFGYGATDYFDGSYSDSGGLWTGAAHHSSSYFYNNYYQKAPRIARDIDLFLPSNTPYYVFIKQGSTNTLAYVDALVSGTVPLSGITP